ncbi:TadE/TadG family type IV pilus assembly protein [Paraburkholderia phenazinium]|jgi:Flp pilus assembly protein TadG|uniref:TadE-like protein n=1 Tax=Paraburkholderia phenazinium TaxID=60549 RepID=A0A1G8HRQ4_9BURK|nr:TadE/TadG family type IV pilus assembly protein [Paraburkholderia phenazinium]SDI09309.1 TadE-like protein [Paraburkholderia phenazinium]
MNASLLPDTTRTPLRAALARPAARLRKTQRPGRQRGIAAIEFALLAPPLLVIVLGMAQFGWLLGNYVMVANATSSAARYFASQRGNSTPYSTTKTQVTTAASYLVTGNLSITTYVNGTQCTTDTECATALSTAAGDPATVTVTYSSFSPLFKGTLAGLVGMPASLNSTMIERVQ